MERLSTVTASQIVQHRTLEYVQWLSCLAERGSPASASQQFLDRWPRALSADIVKRALTTYETKAAVAAGTTSDANWAAPLAPDQLADAFVALVRSASLIGRIPNLRTVPLFVKTPTETQGASYAWIGQGAPKPISKMAFDAGVTLGPTKCVGIIIVSEELGKLSRPGTEGTLRDTLIAGATAFTDTSFIDPTSATVPNIKPGSVTNGTTPVAGTGDLVKDVGALLDAFYAGRPGAENAVLIANGANAAKISAGTSGSNFGLPVIVSGAAGTNVVVLDPTGVFVADNGVVIDTSQYATVEMVDNPAAPTAATILRDLWSHNEIGYRVERFVNWQALPNAVKYLTTP